MVKYLITLNNLFHFFRWSLHFIAIVIKHAYVLFELQKKIGDMAPKIFMLKNKVIRQALKYDKRVARKSTFLKKKSFNHIQDEPFQGSSRMGSQIGLYSVKSVIHIPQ